MPLCLFQKLPLRFNKEESNVQPVDSIAVSTNTNAIIASPTITITDTSISQVTSSVIDTVICVSCPPPTILINNTATDLNGCAYTGVRISWAANPGDWGDGGTGTRTYAVLRDGISIASGLAYGTTTFLDTAGTDGQTYLYQVQYSNGCTSTANTTGIQIADYPGLPTIMDTTAIDKSPMLDTGVKILWSPPTDWGDSGTNTANRAFRVYRSSTDISGLLPASTLSYEDTGGVNNTDYLYHINAINGCGLISLYNSMTARDAVSAPGTVPDNDNYPGIPLTIAKSGTNNIVLYWGAPAGSCQTQDYGIYRGTLPWTAYDHASVLCTTGGSTTTTISAGANSYYYLVVAQYGGNEGSYGLDSSNNQRPHAGTSCFPQNIGSCETGTWAHEYGAAGIDQAYAMQQTNDGGYVIAGYTESLGANSNDIWVVKLDPSGNISWQKTYGGNSDDLVYSIQQTSDGGYIIAGITLSFGAGKGDAWVLKLDSSGNVTWQKAYGGLNFDVAYSVRQTSDGGYIVVGNISTTYDDAWVIRLDSSGNIIWQYTYGGPNSDYAYAVQQTSDGGFIVAGDTYSFGSGSADLWVFKLTASGFASWQKIYGGSSSERASSIQQTSDGGYIVAGYTSSFGAGNSDAWILKLDSSGTVIWQKTYGQSDSEQIYSIQQTSDGGFIAAAIGPLSGYPWIFKLDLSGNIIWQKTYSGDMINSIQSTNDGGYVVSGYASDTGSQNFWIFKISSEGTMAPSCTFINNTSISSNDSLAPSSLITPTISTPAITVTDTSVSSVISNGIDTLICPFPFK